MLTDEEDNLIDFLEDKFGCHTVVLYGSRAINTHRPDSDWDVLGITSMGSRNFYHDHVEGVGDVSAYIYNIEDVEYKPEALSPLYNPLVAFKRLHQGKVLVQQDSIGDKIVARAKQVFSAGPRPSKTWIYHYHYHLMGYGIGGLRNPVYDDMHKQYIRQEVVPLATTLYFELRHIWRPYPRDIYPFMVKNDPEAARLYKAACAPGSTVDELEEWFRYVLTPTQP